MARKLLIVAILLLLFGGFGAGLTMSGVIVNSTTVKFQMDSSWEGRGTWAKNELFDAPAYVSGFNGNGHSDKIVAAGEMFKYSGTSCTRWSGLLYRFWFKPAQGTYPPEHTFIPENIDIDNTGRIPSHAGYVMLKEHASIPTSDVSCPNQKIAPPSQTTVKGSFYGELLVEFYGKFDNFLYSRWNLMAIDRAALNPGWAVIDIQNSDSLVQVGEDLRIHYDVGAACAKSVDPAASNPCGWTLMVRNRDTDPDSGTGGSGPSGWTDKTLADFTEGTVTVRVNADWFTIGEYNEYNVKLFNAVNLQAAKTFVTIDDKNLAPGSPVVTVSPGPPYRQGQSITLTAVSEPNALSGTAIKDYHFIVRQGTRVWDERSTTGTFTFAIADESIDIQVEVTAFDGSRTSGVDRRTLVVLDDDWDNKPPGGGGGLSVLAIMLILAGAALMVFGFVLPIPNLFGRMMMVFVGLVLLAIGFLSVFGVL
jgi:hypothetical protein